VLSGYTGSPTATASTRPCCWTSLRATAATAGWPGSPEWSRWPARNLAWPELKIGIEYEGEPHTERARVLRDIARHTRLVDLGWRIYRYTKLDVYGEPGRIVAELTRARRRAPPT
jgi:hypothetical protein